MGSFVSDPHFLHVDFLGIERQPFLKPMVPLGFVALRVHAHV
jgi:hypothetical protein